MTWSRKRREFSEQDIREMVELYERYNFSCRLISEMFNCAYNTVRHRLIEQGISRDISITNKTAWKNNLTIRKPKSKVSEEGRKNMSKAFRKRALKQLGISSEDELCDTTVKQQTRFIRQALQMVLNSKSSVKADLLGYTQDELINFITSKFKEGMSWEERKSFHIDHIIPVRVFIHKGILDLHLINSLANLQVLHPKENLSKGCRYDSSKFEEDLDILKSFVKNKGN